MLTEAIEPADKLLLCAFAILASLLRYWKFSFFTLPPHANGTKIWAKKTSQRTFHDEGMAKKTWKAHNNDSFFSRRNYFLWRRRKFLLSYKCYIIMWIRWSFFSTPTIFYILLHHLSHFPLQDCVMNNGIRGSPLITSRNNSWWI